MGMMNVTTTTGKLAIGSLRADTTLNRGSDKFHGCCVVAHVYEAVNSFGS